MTQLELLELALEGARERLHAAAHNFDVTRGRYEKSIDWIRKELAVYDKIKEQIDSAEKE